MVMTLMCSTHTTTQTVTYTRGYCMLVCKRLNNMHLSGTSVATNAREILDGRPKLPLGHGHRELEGAAETKDTT